MSDQAQVRFRGKEKFLIGIYLVATAASIALFAAILVVLLQDRSSEREHNVTEGNAMGKLEKRTSDLYQEIIQLEQEIENLVNVTGKLKERDAALNDEIIELRTWSVATRKDIGELRENVDTILDKDINSPMCRMGVAYPGREVPDGNIKASTEFSANYGSRFGRLNMPWTWSNYGGWSARNNENGEWIGVDFGMVKKIRGAMTQGRSDKDQWVTSYKISCSNATGKSNIILGDKVYGGNFDRDTIVTNLFSPSKSCRFVRIYPQTWAAHISLRMEWLTTCP